MRKTLFCGVDLHSNNAMYVITDGRDRPLFRRRLPNELPVMLESWSRTASGSRSWRSNRRTTGTGWWTAYRSMAIRLSGQPGEMKQYKGIKAADDLTDAAFLAHLARLEMLPTGYIYPRQDRPVRDLLRRRMLLVRQRTGIMLSLQNMVMRQSGRSVGWRASRAQRPERAELLGDHDCLTFVADQQVELIELFSKKIKRFEKKVLEHAQLRPAYECLLTMPGVGVILALTIMLETGDIGRFKTVGDYTSYCRCVRATHTSNGKKKDENNGRNGNAYLAWAFVEAVHHAMRVCPKAKSFYDKKLRQTQRGPGHEGVGGEVE